MDVSEKIVVDDIIISYMKVLETKTIWVDDFFSTQKMVENQKEETDNFHLMFGTPNTQRQRTYGLDWSFNRLSREFTADLTCPHHISHLEGMALKEWIASPNGGSFIGFQIYTEYIYRNQFNEDYLENVSNATLTCIICIITSFNWRMKSINLNGAVYI